ncbi:hypothetical protein C4D60_Mb03t00010 [Musa balbisiana]|uniref:Uncharacterized protein n=1 Tax=Musa balbisiana TaxID=52838 RepID=A0A4S8J6E9_MUSBA|nr:hypothetical protein C4D60_Mb03t00010 [Musa balbisiana]
MNDSFCVFLSIGETTSPPPRYLSLFLLLFLHRLRSPPFPNLSSLLLPLPPCVCAKPRARTPVYDSITIVSNLSRFEPNKNRDTTKPRPFPTSQQSAWAHPCPKHTDSFPSGDSLSPQRRLRRFLGERLSSSPSLNSGSNDGVFLRGVLGCGVFLDERQLLRLPLYRRNDVSAPSVSLSLSSPLPPPPSQPPLPQSLLPPPPSSTLPFVPSRALGHRSDSITIVSNLSRFEPNKNRDTTKPRPFPTSQQSAWAHPCPKHTDSFPSGDSLSPQRRLRRFLGERLSSSPSANSGSNGGVFLRGVIGCGVFPR